MRLESNSQMQERNSTDLLIKDKKKIKAMICRSSLEQGQEVRGLAVLSMPAWIKLLGCHIWGPQEMNCQRAL